MKAVLFELDSEFFLPFRAVRQMASTRALFRLSAKDLERLVERARVNVVGVGSEPRARCQVGVIGERVEQVPLFHVIDTHIRARARQILTTVVKDHFSDLNEMTIGIRGA